MDYTVTKQKELFKKCMCYFEIYQVLQKYIGIFLFLLQIGDSLIDADQSVFKG